MSAASSSDAGKPRRNQAVEALRVVAAFGIVAFHADVTGAQAFYAGLVIFLFLAPMFETGANFARSRTATGLARTLLVPYIFWYVVYLVANAAFGKPPFIDDRWLGVVFAGPSTHLWFLPFIFLVLLTLNFAKQRVAPAALLLAASIAAAAVLASAGWWRGELGGVVLPLPQWAQAAPAVLLGLAFGLRERVGVLRIAGLAAVLAALVVLVISPVKGMTVPYFLGTLACVLAVWLGPRLPAKLSVQPVADCMLGVYLVHILALAVINRVVPEGTMLAVCLAFGGSLLAVYMARRLVPLCRIVLG